MRGLHAGGVLPKGGADQRASRKLTLAPPAKTELDSGRIDRENTEKYIPTRREAQHVTATTQVNSVHWHKTSAKQLRVARPLLRVRTRHTRTIGLLFDGRDKIKSKGRANVRAMLYLHSVEPSDWVRRLYPRQLRVLQLVPLQEFCLLLRGEHLGRNSSREQQRTALPHFSGVQEPIRARWPS